MTSGEYDNHGNFHTKKQTSEINNIQLQVFNPL